MDRRKFFALTGGVAAGSLAGVPALAALPVPKPEPQIGVDLAKEESLCIGIVVEMVQGKGEEPCYRVVHRSVMVKDGCVVKVKPQEGETLKEGEWWGKVDPFSDRVKE